MKSFNLSEWALNHRSFTWFLMIVSLFAGAMSYMSMGREEDPPFSIPTMVVAAAMPGATAEEMQTQVTDRIERKLQELDGLDVTRSVTYPGQTVVYVDVGDSVKNAEIDAAWQRVRNMMADIRGDFTPEFKGFTFNDDFGAVYGNVYAFTSDGFSPDEVKTYVEDIRDEVQKLDAAGKVDLIGTRERVVHIEFSATRLAALGLNGQSVLAALAAQNQIVPSGSIQTGNERILIRVSGQFEDVEALAEAPLRIGDVFFTLTDVATITEGYEDPPASLMRYNGEPAIGLKVGMRDGENILEFGQALDTLMSDLVTELPIGIELHKIADQPHVVDESVGHFLRALVEAVLIVLAVSFISLGMRAGFIVSLSIPLVLALTFVVLELMGITLQRISLGALIIALGLLVDDAMITIETMISRLERGEGRAKAASYAWTSIAWPMLTGTLITAAGFIPIGLNGSAAGEYTRSLFWVIFLSLNISWFVAVMFAPVLGATFLPKNWKHHDPAPGILRRMFHRILRFAMRFRWLTIALTLAAFAVSVAGLGKVEQQFFPTGDRPEVVVDVSLRQNVSIYATDAEMKAFEDWLGDREGVEFWTTYVGTGAPRFVLTLQGPTAGPHVGQIVINTTGVEARDRLAKDIAAYSDSRVGVEFFAKYIELGPPVGKPVQYRITGPDAGVLRDKGRELAAVLAADDRLHAIELNWNEPVRVVRVDLDQARLRQLGLTQSDVAGVLASLFEGTGITALRQGRDLIEVLMRGEADDRTSLSSLGNLQFAGVGGVPIPLSSIATLEWTTEQPILHQRNRVPEITVSAAIATSDQPATIVEDLTDDIAAFGAELPRGFEVAVGGAVEESADSQAPIVAAVPIMLLIILFLAMLQVQSFRTMFVVMAVAPLGLIGVVVALLASGAPLGFVAILGVLALMGILIRNAIILAQAIDDLIAAGKSRWEAVFLASDQRARPILLTAAAASLALIPISRQVFWGPMAYAMMGGIIVGTLITLIFAPALYVAVYRVKPEGRAEK